MIGDNAPPPPDWHPTPRACPLPDCDVCNPRSQIGFGFETYPSVPDNIELGQE